MALTEKAAGYVETRRVQMTVIYAVGAFIDICNQQKRFMGCV